MIQSILAISLGAALGAVSRWLLGLGLNAVFPAIPLGTLAANLMGGYLIGVQWLSSRYLLILRLSGGFSSSRDSWAGSRRSLRFQQRSSR